MSAIRVSPLAAVPTTARYYESYDVDINQVIQNFTGGSPNRFNLKVNVPKPSVSLAPVRVMAGFIADNIQVATLIGNTYYNVFVKAENTYNIGGVSQQLPISGNQLYHYITNNMNLSFSDEPLSLINLENQPNLLELQSRRALYGWPGPASPDVNGNTSPIGAILPAFDGTLDFAGNSGYSAPSLQSRQVPVPFGFRAGFIECLDPVKLANFAGSGTIDIYGIFRPRQFFIGFPNSHWGLVGDEWVEFFTKFRIIYEFS